MSTYTTDRASPFTRAVVSSMRKLLANLTKNNHPSGIIERFAKSLFHDSYPEALADKSFDNTGCEKNRLSINWSQAS